MPTTSPADRVLSRRILATGLALGLLAELVFDGRAFGINIAIATAGLLAAAWLLRRPGRAPDPLDAWLPLSAMILALLVAVRGDPFLAVLDSLVALACCGATAVAFSGLAVTRRSASVIAAMGAWVIGSAVADPFRAVIESRPAPAGEPRRLPEWVAAVARGLVVAVPLALIFAVLFASADPVFARAVGNVLGFRDRPRRAARSDPVHRRRRLAGGRRGLGLGPRHPRLRGRLARRGQPDGTDPDTRVLGLPEALVILVLVDFVIALFVGLQFAYLFGGRAANGMAYADYARRGFFELVAAACLSSVVVIVLESTVVRRTRPYLAALIALIALTAVVLGSAALRLRLYQDAYGWTELRLYVLAAIVTIGLGLAAMADPGAGRSKPLDPAHAGRPRRLLAGRARSRRAGGVRREPERRAGHRPVARAAGRPRRPGHRVPGRPPGRRDPGPRPGAPEPPARSRGGGRPDPPGAQGRTCRRSIVCQRVRLEPRPGAGARRARRAVPVTRPMPFLRR